jgi:hypothetical protein
MGTGAKEPGGRGDAHRGLEADQNPVAGSRRRGQAAEAGWRL